VDHAPLVRVLDGLGGLPDEIGRLPLRQPDLALDPVLEAAALDDGHRQVGPAPVLPDLEDGDDMRVIELRGETGLLGEAAGGLLRVEMSRQDHPQGHRPPEAALAGPVDDPHASAGDLL
jgi:hypothetical protein